MAVIGRWEIFTRNGWEARNGVVGFIMRDRKFLKSLYIVGRRVVSCFFGLMADHTTFDMLFYLMVIWTYTC